MGAAVIACYCLRVSVLRIKPRALGLSGPLPHLYPSPVKLKMEGCGDGSGGRVLAHVHEDPS